MSIVHSQLYALYVCFKDTLRLPNSDTTMHIEFTLQRYHTFITTMRIYILVKMSPLMN